MEHHVIGCNSYHLESNFAFHPEDKDAKMPDKCENCGSGDIEITEA